MQILAFNPNKSVFKIPEINQQLDLLAVPRGILYDRQAKSELGDISQMLAERSTVSSILNNRRVTVMGFIPGYPISHGIYYLMANYVELRVSMNTGIALQVFGLNILMCTISGAIAIRKRPTADPADIFY